MDMHIGSRQEGLALGGAARFPVRRSAARLVLTSVLVSSGGMPIRRRESGAPRPPSSSSLETPDARPIQLAVQFSALQGYAGKLSPHSVEQAPVSRERFGDAEHGVAAGVPIVPRSWRRSLAG
jgi:hypothetical protein